MANTYPHQNPVSGPLSLRHMYNAEYRPGEDESINYRVQRRKRMESVNPCPKCGNECECGPNCGCGSECECCGIVSEDMQMRPYVAVHVQKGKTEVRATSSYGAAKAAAQKWGLKSTAGIDTHLADVKKTATENTLMRFKTFFSEEIKSIEEVKRKTIQTKMLQPKDWSQIGSRGNNDRVAYEKLKKEYNKIKSNKDYGWVQKVTDQANAVRDRMDRIASKYGY